MGIGLRNELVIEYFGSLNLVIKCFGSTFVESNTLKSVVIYFDGSANVGAQLLKTNRIIVFIHTPEIRPCYLLYSKNE